jgi:hypothetical protein
MLKKDFWMFIVHSVVGFVGYAPEMYALISDHEVKDRDDDQLYYTELYLDEGLRVSTLQASWYVIVIFKFVFQNRISIRLDHRAHLFQNLNGARDEVALVVKSNETYLYNSIYDTRAVVYHGNGPSKVGGGSLS